MLLIINDDILDALQAAVVTPPLLAMFDLSGQPSKAVDIPIADAESAAAVYRRCRAFKHSSFNF